MYARSVCLLFDLEPWSLLVSHGYPFAVQTGSLSLQPGILLLNCRAWMLTPWFKTNGIQGHHYQVHKDLHHGGFYSLQTAAFSPPQKNPHSTPIPSDKPPFPAVLIPTSGVACCIFGKGLEKTSCSCSHAGKNTGHEAYCNSFNFIPNLRSNVRMCLEQ